MEYEVTRSDGKSITDKAAIKALYEDTPQTTANDASSLLWRMV